MKIYLCNEVIRDLDFPSQCRFARETGYDGLEIAPFTLMSNPDQLRSEIIRKTRSTAESENIAIAGLHWLLAEPPGLSITSSDPTIASKTRDFGKQLIEICCELGGSYLVHGSPSQRVLEKGREQEGRMRAIEYFAMMAEHSDKAGVMYYLEPLHRGDSTLITSIDEAVEIMHEIGSDALATMVDCYAMARNGEDICSLLKEWLPTGIVRHLHFNDPNRRGPGEGELPFSPIIDVLCDLGYGGTSAVEPFEYRPSGTACAARAIGYLRGLLEERR